MIKNDPQRLALRKSARAIIILSILFIILAVINYFIPSSSGQRSFSLPLLYLIAMFFFLAVLALAFYTVKRLDKRRALAIQGDQRMLATEQPVPNVNALPLPISIELRPPNRFYYIWLGTIIVGGLTGGIIVPFLLHTGNHTGSHSSLIVLIIVLAILVAVLILLLAILFFILRRRMRYQVHVDEQAYPLAIAKLQRGWIGIPLASLLSMRSKNRGDQEFMNWPMRIRLYAGCGFNATLPRYIYSVLLFPRKSLIDKCRAY